MIFHSGTPAAELRPPDTGQEQCGHGVPAWRNTQAAAAHGWVPCWTCQWNRYQLWCTKTGVAPSPTRWRVWLGALGHTAPTNWSPING